MKTIMALPGLRRETLASIDIRVLILSTLILQFQPLCVQAGRKYVNFRPIEMSRSETIAYFNSVLQQKGSSLDRLNEKIYFDETFAEDLYHRIDHLMPRPMFIKYLLKTKNITDKTDSNGASLLSVYSGELNRKCNPDTVWNHDIPVILKVWDGDRSIVFNDLENYHKLNQHADPKLICNRFRGLSCQYKRTVDPLNDHGKSQTSSEWPTCQCVGDVADVGYYYKKSDKYPANDCPDGCYIRTWRPCQHLSVDQSHQESYVDWHTSLSSQRSQLAQMVFPVARPHRCHQGTYCVDLIPGMKTPICWCAQDSPDPQCQANEKNPDIQKRVPSIGDDFIETRTKFRNLFLKTTDVQSTCYPELNSKIEKLANDSGKDPTVTGAFHVMKEIVAFAEEQKRTHGTKIRICDFRQGFSCDSGQRKCQGKMTCEPGKIHIGKGVCVVNNAEVCQSTGECVENAKCQLIEGTGESVCQCQTGYGDTCALQNPAFFSKLFIPITSGFRGEEYVQHQVKISNILEAWENSMNRKVDELCDPEHDGASMKIVDYFGNLKIYDPKMGEPLLAKAKQVIQDQPNLCMYTKFLRCHPYKRKCVSMVGKILPGNSPYDQNRIHVEVQANKECGRQRIPLIFQDFVEISCVKGFQCKENPATCLSEGAMEEQDKEWALGRAAGRSMLGGRSSFSSGVRDYDDEDWGFMGRQAVTPGTTTIAPTGGSTTMAPTGPGRSTTMAPTGPGGSTTIAPTGPGGSTTITPTGPGGSTTITPTGPGGSTTMTPTGPGGSTTITPTGPGGSTTITPTGPGGSTTITPTGPGGSTTITPTGPGGSTTITPTGPGGSTTMTPTGPGGSTTITPTGPGGSTTIVPTVPGPSTTPITTTTVTVVVPTNPTPSPIPQRKALYHESCQFNDDQTVLNPDDDDIARTCDASHFLVCKNSHCECAPALKYVPRELKCLIPLGFPCDEESVDLPSYMNYAELLCQNGACMTQDKGKQICRPETDDGLLLVNFIPS